MKLFFAILLSLGSCLCFSQEKINVILIGTYHFNNPGFDRGKVIERDILNKKNQAALEEITTAIVKNHHPDKVFVEFPFNEKEELNKKYLLYKDDKPFYKADTLKSDFLKRMYAENEIFQFGFRLAKKANNSAIYSTDHNLEQRYDLLGGKLENSKQVNAETFQGKMAALNNYMNSCIAETELKDVFKCLNSDEQMRLNKGLYVATINRLNDENEFFGSDFVASWYKRNLIMYANIQNQVTTKDKTIVVIVGAGHAAIIQDFIKNDYRFNLLDFKKVVN
ncbi:hypothetical protein GR160_09015 [Flavobacterium sp. Sd200]|uniref:DUF5694 domain-containing protein n=1 Tax=Flavobacterium sp. Sd200 TaxID=2692211 RepID=UPI0013720E6F|nr:DUF5694 domain-containing protein [Flavobacterium sp. Sd200]MXN91368.1 hypothetical protein [Flavobacterium sp. Sd200]